MVGGGVVGAEVLTPELTAKEPILIIHLTSECDLTWTILAAVPPLPLS
jgi:hypothetical protein